MAFHNFNGLISMHKRTFQLFKFKEGSRGTTSRFESGSFEEGVTCEGCYETISELDLKRNGDLELTYSDIKLLTSPDLMNKITPNIKDKISYNGTTYSIVRIVNDIHYGNFYRIFLKKKDFRM